jgi:5'-methylthioadenosine phosphorylase
MALGIITGSGTYALPGMESSAREVVATRFGETEVTRGRFAGQDVLHVSRHRDDHERLSSHVTHQANVIALQELGARAVLAVTVCGATDPTLGLGELVVFDDLHFLANRLADGSLCTLHDRPGAAGRGHWVFEDPFSEPLRAALLEGARERGHAVRDGGCYGHVDGPRFNTKAEIRSLRAVGVSAVSQTAGPEMTLCGEAGLPYGLLGYVTDYANGVADEATPVATLMRLLRESGATLADTLVAAVGRIDLAAIPPVGTQIAWE